MSSSGWPRANEEPDEDVRLRRSFAIPDHGFSRSSFTGTVQLSTSEPFRLR